MPKQKRFLSGRKASVSVHLCGGHGVGKTNSSPVHNLIAYFVHLCRLLGWLDP
jgi:hypothetical protein